MMFVHCIHYIIERLISRRRCAHITSRCYKQTSLRLSLEAVKSKYLHPAARASRVLSTETARNTTLWSRVADFMPKWSWMAKSVSYIRGEKECRGSQQSNDHKGVSKESVGCVTDAGHSKFSMRPPKFRRIF